MGVLLQVAGHFPTIKKALLSMIPKSAGEERVEGTTFNQVATLQQHCLHTGKQGQRETSLRRRLCHSSVRRSTPAGVGSAAKCARSVHLPTRQ